MQKYVDKCNSPCYNIIKIRDTDKANRKGGQYDKVQQIRNHEKRLEPL